MIEAYLAELRRALGRRFLVRGRLLAEAEGHLRESAAALERSGLSAEESEREAVARFGPASTVAAEAVHSAWPRSLVPAALLLLGAVALSVFPLYGIPENTLPPAPWESRPDYLTWQLYASLAAYAAAFVAGALALVAAWRGWRIAPAALAIGLGAFAVTAALGVALALQWALEVPGSGTTLTLALPAWALTTTLGALAVVVTALHAPRFQLER